jgi:BirA family biotin operon repressor/biotin-[acetyl-CoA-carboxylase] ligase
MSLLLRPKTTDAGRLTTLASVVVSDAILRVCGIEVGIKWVNDLLFDGKKLCGILAEGTLGEFMVIGIGINVKKSAFPPELADIATSLEDILGAAPDRNALVAEILRGFADADLEGVAHMDEYRRRSLTLGKTVTVLSTGETVRVLAIEDDGALLVEAADGQTRRFFSGEVSVRNV